MFQIGDRVEFTKSGYYYKDKDTGTIRRIDTEDDIASYGIELDREINGCSLGLGNTGAPIKNKNGVWASNGSFVLLSNEVRT
jgi:hypothetical protein